MKTLFLVLLLPIVIVAQPDLKKLDAYYAKALKDWNVPGMSVAIVKDGKIVLMKGYGVREIGKPEPADENTLYAIASISKAFTTTTFAMLEQEGKLSLDDKVRKHLPYFELYNPYVSQDAAIRDLLCHRLGYATFSGDVIWYLSDKLTAEQIVRNAKHLPQSYPYRAGYGYCNVMYIAAGEVMNKASGMTWHEAVKTKIFDQLGMSRTITSIKDLDKKGNYAAPHGMIANEQKSIPWEDWSIIAPTGGIISSAKDMANWMLFNLNYGIWGKDTLLSKQLFNTLWTPHNTFVVDHTDANNDNHFRAYGLGWNLMDYKGKLRVGHTGGYSGMVSNLALIPDEKLGIVVLTNSNEAPGLMIAIVNHTIDAYLGKVTKDWSADMLKLFADFKNNNDTRVKERETSRVANTSPSLPAERLVGIYDADIYGTIEVKQEQGKLRLYFEHSNRFNATLEHWQYDV